MFIYFYIYKEVIVLNLKIYYLALVIVFVLVRRLVVKVSHNEYCLEVLWSCV